MTLFKLIFAVVVIALLGGLGYFAFVETPVQQTEIVKEIPKERLINEQK